MKRYEIHSLDVWGNPKDGYEVNQAFHTGIFIEISEDDSDKDILRKLAEVDVLTRNWKRYKLEIDCPGDDHFMTVIHASQQANGLPLWNLVAEYGASK